MRKAQEVARPDDDVLLTNREVREMLKVSATTLFLIQERGELVYTYAGKQRRTWKSDVIKYLDARRVGVAV